MKKRLFMAAGLLVSCLLCNMLTYASANNLVYEKSNPYYILVNKQHGLGKDYKPKNLVIPNVKFSQSGLSEKKYMQNTAAYNLKKMFDEAARQKINLVAVSGYRSYNRQGTIYYNYIRQFGQKATERFSAKPGFSEHQTGLAMDVSSQSAGYNLSQNFANTKEGKWLAENAYQYGFIIRYPKDKEKITGYMYEPWHVRYVGTELAHYLYINHLTLEEMGSFFKQSEKTEVAAQSSGLKVNQPSNTNETTNEKNLDTNENTNEVHTEQDSFLVIQE